MVPIEVRKIIVESRAKGITANEVSKVTGVSVSAIANKASLKTPVQNEENMI